jgi:hypothetical protein
MLSMSMRTHGLRRSARRTRSELRISSNALAQRWTQDPG